MKQTLRGRRPSRLGAHQGGSVRRLGLHYVLLTFALTFSCYCINTSTAQDATTDRPTATATATPTATAVAPTLKPDIEFYSGVNGVGSSYFVNVNVTTSVESVYYRVSASSNAPCPSSSSSSTLFSNVMFQNLPFVPKSIRVNIQKYQIILYGWYANNGDHICGPSWTLLNYDSNGNPSTGLFNINSWIVDNTAYSGVWKISPIQEKPTTQIPTTLPPTTQTPTTATPTTQIPTTLPPTTQTPTTLPPTTLPPTNTPTTLPTTTRVVVLDFTLRSLRTDKSQCGWYGVYWPTDTGYVTIQYDTQTGSLSFPRFHWSIAERDQCNTPSIAASPVQLWLYDPSGSTPLNTTAGQCIQTLKNGIRNNANQDVEVSTCSIKQEYRQEFLLKAQKKQITFCIINKDLNTCILDSQQTTYIQDQCSTNNGGCHPLSTCTTAANGTAICGSIPTTETPTTPAPTTTNAPKPDIEFYSGVNGIGSSYFMNVNVTTSGDVYYRVSAPSNAPCPSSSSTSSLFSNVMFQNLPFVPKSIRVNIQKYQIILYGWYNNNGDNICGPSWTLLNYDNNGNPSTGLFNINSWIVDYTAYSGVWKISTIQEKPTTQIPTTLTPTTQTPTTLPPTTQPATTRVVILDFTLRSLRTNKAECGWYGVYWPTDTGYATIKYDTQTGSLSFPRLHWSIAERDQCNTPSIPASSVVFGLNGLSDNNSGLALNTTNGQCIQTLVNGIRNNANQDAIVSTCTIKPEYRQEFLLKAQQKQISFCIINKELNTCILNSQQTTYIQDQCSTNNGGCHPLSTCTTAPNGTAICAVPKPTEPMKFNDYGYPYRTRGWFDVQGLGKALDYCRYVGTGDIWFSCALAGGTFEYTAPGVIIEKRVINIPRPNPLPPATGPALATVSDRGLPDLTRVEVDLFGRGEAWDYCRMVSNTSNPQFIWFSCVFAGYQGKEIYTKPGEILITAEYAPTTLPPTTQAPTSAVDPCTADSVKPYLPGRIYQPLSVYECCSYEGYKWCAIYYTSNPPSENTNGQFGPWRKIAACAGTTTTRPPTTTTPTPTPTPTPTITRPPPTTQAPSTAAPTTATPTTAAPTIVTPTAPVPTSFNWTSVTERTWTHPFQSSISFVYNNPPRNTPLYVRVQGRSTLITQGTTSSSIQVSANVNLKGNQQLTSMTVEILRDDQDGIPIAADHIYTQVVTRSAISRVALPDPILNAMANGQDAAMSSQPCPSSANTGAIVGGVVAAMTVLIILTNIATHVITKRHQPKVQSKPVAENWNVNPVTTEGVVVVV